MPKFRAPRCCECSLSLDESNDLRAKLGLAPLRAKKQVVQGDSAISYRSRADAAADEQKREQLQARLSSAKRAREAAAAQEADRTSAVHGAASDWVASMRQRKVSRRAVPATKSSATTPKKRAAVGTISLDHDDEDDFEAGIAVRHDVQDFTEGQSVVLTLADTNLLDEAAGGDVLQNTRMMDQAKADLANERKGKLAKSRGGSSYSKVPAAGGMLSRWEEGDAAALQGTRALLTASGALVPSTAREVGEASNDASAVGAVRDRLQSAAAAQGVVRMASDFMTAEEAAASMPKPKRSKDAKHKKRKRSKRSRVEDEDEPNLADPAGGGYFKGKEGSLGGGSGAGAAMAAQLLASNDQADGPNAPASADSSASVAAARARMLSGAAPTSVNPLTKQRTYRAQAGGAPEHHDEDEGDDGAGWASQLQASLSRARAATMAGPSVPSDTAVGSAAAQDGDVDVAAVAARLAAARAARDAAKAASAAAGPASSNALVFSSTDEFKRRMEAARAQQSHQSASAASSAASSAGHASSSTQLEEELQEAQEHVTAAQADGSLTAEDGGTAGGTASALAFLRRTGALKPVKSRAQIAGRANDKLMDDDDDPAPGIQLKYHDAFGREMTQKEAFRHLNYKFHGYGSGKGKRDKKLKAYMDSVEASKKS